MGLAWIKLSFSCQPGDLEDMNWAILPKTSKILEVNDMDGHPISFNKLTKDK